MGEDINCKLLCHGLSKDVINWDEASSQHVIQMVQHEYFVHLLEHFIVILNIKKSTVLLISKFNLKFFTD